MENKKSFVLYADLLELVESLPMDKRGELFTIILNYVNDKDPEINDALLKVAFIPIKQSLKRDLKKYQATVERNRKNGLKGGRPKNTINQNNPVGLLGKNENPKKPKKADNDNDNDNDNVSDIITTKEQKEKVVYRKYLADANNDINDFKDVLRKIVIDRESSIKTLLIESDIDYGDDKVKNRIWLDFIKNAVIHTPTINNEDHGYKCFKLFINNNKLKYKKMHSTFEGFG
jgi:hypothetical protein